MTETQKRIQAYKKALPGMKERVSAVAMLLIVSISMMTSATFAWVTLSRNPEISSIATTVTTNGNLEIALSGKEGLEPADTTLSDGGQEVTRSNLTWGNLINLSDESYNLSGISLRPAALNINKLDTSPVFATKYSEDGRVEGFITDFAFTNYDSTLGEYAVPKETEYGVRGVSSVTYKNITGNKFLVDQLSLIYQTYAQACTDFKVLYSNQSYMGVVYKLVQEYANVSLGNESQDIGDQMPALMEMMDDLVDVVKVLGTAYAEMANVAYFQTLTDVAQYTPYTVQDVIDNKIPADYTKHLTYYTTYRTLYSAVIRAYNGLDAAAAKAEQGQAVYWSGISTYANILCDMASAELNGYTVTGLKQAIKDNLSFGLTVAGWDRVPAVIKKGVLKDIDQFLAGDFYVASNDNLAVAVSFKGVDITLHPYVYTAAYQSTDLNAVKDYNATETVANSGGTNLKGDATAAETYAMAIDFWVRTNEENALLILEGEVITEEKPILVVVDNNGTTAELYLYEYTDSEYTTQTLQVYKVTENGTDTWYTVETKQPLTEVVENVEITESNPKLQTREVVVGYKGANRVWDELDDENNAAVMLPPGTTSTTQGSGSCYVFYPKNPEDMMQGLHLLSAMRIAFVEGKTLLGQAYMDVDCSYFESGRVTVPLKLYANKAIELDDGTIESEYITRLRPNEARRITALIYLSGTGLENSDVLSAGSITGQMNIQFGTNIMELDPMDLPDMKNDSYKIECVAPLTTFDSPLLLEDKPWKMDLSMLLDGLNPSSVKGNFVSVINATQGARQDTFTMLRNPDTGFWEAYTYIEGVDGAEGTWEKGVSFTAPGNYQLHSLQIDGVDYALSAENVVYVKVPGMSISSLTWAGDATGGNTLTVLTAESYVEQTLNLSLGSEEIHSVQGVFLGSNGKNVTVEFTPTGGIGYSGTGTFTTSGIYEMTYLYIDGVITALDADQYKTITINLGLQADIKLSPPYFASDSDLTQEDKDRILDPNTLTFTPGVGYSYVYTGEETLYFDITCTVSDDQDHPMGALGEKVILNYKQGNKQNALSEILTWNASKERYEGTFNNFEAKFGVFQFHQLVIEDENSISYITKGTAHGITSIPAASMEYVGNDLPQNGLVFDLGGSPTVSLKLANASAATLNLTLTDGEGNKATLDSSDEHVCQTSTDADGNTVFTFYLPDDGVWTITGVKAGMVFYDGVFYSGAEDDESTWLDMMGGEAPVIPADELPATEFVTKVSVSVVAPSNEINLGRGDIGTTFSLGADQQIKLSFKAYNGEDIVKYAERAGKKITVSTSQGSYVRAQNVNVEVTSGSINNVLIEGNATLTESAPALVLNVGSFPADGIYTLLGALDVQFKVSDAVNGAVIDTLNMEVSTLPSIKAAWNKPVVKVTATDPKPGTTKRVYTVKEPSSTAQAIQGDFFSISEDKFRATVYIHTPAQGGGYDQEAAEAYAPKVTLGLTGVPTGTTATMVFNTRNTDSLGSTFQFTNGSATAEVGKAVTGSRGLFGVSDYPECYPAGTMTQNVITFTYNNVTYKTTLDNAITIDQPQSPSALNFVGIPETYTGTKPTQVVGKGSAVTVTLPELAWTARIEEPKDGTWSAYTAVGEVDGATTKALSYTTWTVKGTCSTDTYYTYQYFTWTKFQSSITAQTDIYTQDKKITQWVINGKTYNAGQTVTVTGDGIINATAVVSNTGAKTFVETLEQTTYKYLYGYVAEAKVTKTETAPNLNVNIVGTPGNTENFALTSPKLADATKANAATDTPGTNMTTDSAAYANYLN